MAGPGADTSPLGKCTGEDAGQSVQLQPSCRMLESLQGRGYSPAPRMSLMYPLHLKACMQGRGVHLSPLLEYHVGGRGRGAREYTPAHPPKPLFLIICARACVHARGFQPGCTPQPARPMHGYVCTSACAHGPLLMLKATANAVLRGTVRSSRITQRLHADTWAGKVEPAKRRRA